MHWLLLVVGVLMIVGGIAGASSARKRAGDRVSIDPLFSRFRFATVFTSDKTLKEIRNSHRVSWAGLVVAIVGVVSWIMNADEPARSGTFRETGRPEGRPEVAAWLDEIAPPPPPPPPFPDTAASGAPGLGVAQDTFVIAEVMPSISNLERVREVLARSYPDALRGTSIEGRVVVRGIVDTLGRVAAPRVVRSLDPLLDSAALEALSEFEFTPGRMRNAKVPVWTTIIIEFRSGIGVLVGSGST